MVKEPRITPSKLGAFCGTNVCLRCGYFLLRMSFKKPFDFGTPFIMQLLDQRQKQIARVSLEENGELPNFFGPFASATKLIECTSLSAYNTETDLQLYGMPDLVLQNKDGSRMIIDDKTSFPKTEDDALFAKYRVQVNFYGLLSEQAAEAYRISRVGILYYVYVATDDEGILNSVTDSSITVQFAPKIKVMEYDPEKYVMPLLRTVRELLDMTEPPKASGKCKDCKLIADYSALLSVEDDLDYLRKVMDQREFNNYLSRRQYVASISPVFDIEAKTAALFRNADPDGVLANWDFDCA